MGENYIGNDSSTITFECQKDQSLLIEIDGKEIKEQPLYDTAFLVGTVFQNPRAQFFNVDTTSELAFGMENRGMHPNIIRDKITGTVQEFHMEHLMDRSIFKLSGGEKQKIACACVSVCSPKIFILDEPSANLDLKSMQQLRDMIRKWKIQGKTIVIAEHRLSYIWDLVDRAVYLSDGRITGDFSKKEMNFLTEEDLHSRGLRSNREIRTSAVNTMEKNCELVEHTLRFEHMVFGYEKNKAILNIDEMIIKEKAITAIIGNNGVGKSTLLRCICGLESKCRSVLKWNESVYSRKKHLSEIFLVMQDVNHQLFTESVLDEVLISMQKEDEEKALQILKELDLLELKDRHPVSLSGGQKQRVAVATAIASERKILLFDEPTSGLDYNHMLQVAEMLEKLKNQGKTIILVTHDLEFIETLHANVIKLEANANE